MFSDLRRIAGINTRFVTLQLYEWCFVNLLTTIFSDGNNVFQLALMHRCFKVVDLLIDRYGETVLTYFQGTNK